jgi:hypothetical protein
MRNVYFVYCAKEPENLSQLGTQIVMVSSDLTIQFVLPKAVYDLMKDISAIWKRYFTTLPASPGVFTRCDVVGTWSREYQLSSSSSSSYSYYQMRLCGIWSRNAKNFSALFYVVKNVTKSHD